MIIYDDIWLYMIIYDYIYIYTYHRFDPSHISILSSEKNLRASRRVQYEVDSSQMAAPAHHHLEMSWEATTGLANHCSTIM